MRMIFIEIIVFSALAMILTSCASTLKDLNLRASVDFEKDGMKEELSIEGKM